MSEPGNPLLELANAVNELSARIAAIDVTAINSDIAAIEATLADLGTAAGLSLADLDERSRDALGSALVAGAGISVTPNDGTDQIAIAATGIRGVHGLIPVASGQWVPLGLNGVATTNVAVAANRLDMVPFIPARTITLSHLTIQTAVGIAATAARLGIYADNGSGVPGALLIDAGTVSTATNNLTGSAVAAITLDANTLYWLAAHFQDAVTVQSVPLSAALPIRAGIGTSDPTLWRATPAFGALANPAPAATLTSSILPSIRPRIA